MIALLRYVWCQVRQHNPRREYFWDMVGNPMLDGWYTYECPKCGTKWREE